LLIIGDIFTQLWFTEPTKYQFGFNVLLQDFNGGDEMTLAYFNE